MKASEGKIGRVFVVRLEDGDMVPECIEKFAAEKGIKVAHVILIGGIGGGQVVAGPRETDEMPPDPVMIPVEGAHEVEGVGIIAPDKDGNLAFHWKCMMAPQKIVDYIIVHELCHRHHRDHDDAFWNEVDKVMPDYRERKEWLRKNGAGLDV